VLEHQDALPAISAVLIPGKDLDSAVLDLAAVLEGLVADRFEIIVVARNTPGVLADVRARAPGLPLRIVDGETIADGCDAARLNLIFVGARDGQFDVRELNHLLEAIEQGADVAAGYRPRRTDAFIRRLQRWGWKVDLDCAFELFRSVVWRELECRRAGPHEPSCSELLSSVRRLGYQVKEVRVSHRRPTIGPPAATSSRAA